VTRCPRCGEELAYGQEYCLECGARASGRGPFGFAEDPGSGWIRRSLVGLVVAAVGAAAAVAATGGTGTGEELLTATGGFATTPATETDSGAGGGAQAGILDWPAGQEGWTIALATLPQAGGRRAAVARAREARKSDLPTVGVLDTSRYASLHPGYWLVFTGVYTSEAEATSSLRPARAFARTAAVRRVVP
jgi:hypothetical protein